MSQVKLRAVEDQAQVFAKAREADGAELAKANQPRAPRPRGVQYVSAISEVFIPLEVEVEALAKSHQIDPKEGE